MKKEIVIGFLVGIFANLTGSYLYIFFFSDYSLETTLKMAVENNILGSLIALGAILNLIVFFMIL